MDARLSHRDLIHCRAAGRPLTGVATFWEAGMEIRRVSDGETLVTEPPGDAQRTVDVELDCERGRLVRRKGIDETIEESVRKILAPLARPQGVIGNHP